MQVSWRNVQPSWLGNIYPYEILREWDGGVWINISTIPQELHQGSLCHKSSWRTSWDWESISDLSAAQTRGGSGEISAGNRGLLFVKEFGSLGNSSQHSESLKVVLLRDYPPQGAGRQWGRGGWGKARYTCPWARARLLRVVQQWWGRCTSRWGWWSGEPGVLILPHCWMSPWDGAT